MGEKGRVKTVLPSQRRRGGGGGGMGKREEKAETISNYSSALHSSSSAERSIQGLRCYQRYIERVSAAPNKSPSASN